MDLDVSLNLNPDLLADPKEFSALAHVVESLQQSYSNGESGLRPRERYEQDLESVSEVVNKVVEEHYDGFNGSVRSFSKIFTQFTDAQNRVRRLKERVSRCKRSMINRKRNLGSLTYEKTRYEVILDLLEKMQLLQASPLRISHLLNGGKYAKCVDLLLEVHELAYGPELGKVIALKQVREELVLWRHRIQTKLVSLLISSLGPGSYSGDQESTSVEEFATLLKALKRLKRIPSALREIKDSLRDLIQDIIKQTCMQHSSKSRAQFIDPISLLNSKGSRLQEDLDIRDLKVDPFVELLSRLKDFLRAHVSFSEALKQVCDGQDADLYSVRQTWSVIQVEVQQFLDLHLTSDPSNDTQQFTSDQPLYAATNAPEVEDGANLKFRFSVGETTVAETRALFRKQADQATDDIKPLFPPSSFWIVPLYRPVADFARDCDSLLNFPSRQQLLSYVMSFCTDVFLPGLVESSTSRLRDCSRSESAYELQEYEFGKPSNEPHPTPKKQEKLTLSKLSIVLYEELQRLKKYQSFLSGLCSLEPVAFQLLEEFYVQQRDAVAAALRRHGTKKLCFCHVTDLGQTIRKDPYYRAHRHSQENSDLSSALREFNRAERQAELRQKESLLGMYSAPLDATDVEKLLLMTTDLYLLGTTHTSCGWIFERIIEETTETESASDSLFGSTRTRTLLGELDSLSEQCIFYVRSEIRLRCALRLHGVSRELLSETPGSSSSAAAILSAELIEIADSLSPCLIRARYNFVFHGVSVLCSELLVRSVYFAKALSSGTDSSQGERAQLVTKAHAVFLKRISLTLQNVLWSIRITAIDSHINAFDGARLFFLCFIQKKNKDLVKRNLEAAARMLDTVLYDDFVRIFDSVA